MVIRRIGNLGYTGYGSFGITVIEGNAPIPYSMDEEVEAIAAVIANRGGSEAANWAVGFNISWRWKFALINADFDRLQIYNAVTGKGRYGTCVIESATYVASEEFVSYPSQISIAHRTGYVLHGSQGLDDLPCDEPPSDEPITIVPNARWLCKSAQTTINNQIATLPNTAYTVIGEKVTFYPEPPLRSFVFGGSYVWDVVVGYTQDEYENQYGRPPAINI